MKCFFFKHKPKSDLELPKVNGATKSTSPLPSPRSIKESYKEKEHNLRIFTLQELVDATNSFNIKLLIGFGDFGEVYKGTIRPDPEDGVFLFYFICLGKQDCKLCSVLLKDYIIYITNWMFREGPTGDHTGKSIGFARCLSLATEAYTAPEYIATGHLIVLSDIWSFGVVLYEILTGRSAVDRTLPKGEQRLIEWVKKYPANSSRFSTIMDPRLKNQYSLGAARKIAKLADSCLKMNPQDRQSMSQIVESLKQALQYSETTNTSHNMTSKSHSI
ncbi:receptor protein kinase [Spatholobus suberectus]|nr:receptor protein kinase [Spatholobus suberectus]